MQSNQEKWYFVLLEEKSLEICRSEAMSVLILITEDCVDTQSWDPSSLAQDTTSHSVIQRNWRRQQSKDEDWWIAIHEVSTDVLSSDHKPIV